MNDVGGMLGSILIGYISDLTYGKRSPVSIVALFLSCVISFFISLIVSL